jgi:uncharacterized protein YqjF (DUF2071 family)
MIRRALTLAAGAGEALLASIPGTPPEVAQSRVLDQTDNRPWPPPDGPWLMAQTWRDLLFAHWRVPPELLREKLPPALPVDTFDGSAWIGVTPFELSGLRPRGGLPVPFGSRFPELNVRTYTTLDGKPGIFFLSLDAASTAAVIAARRGYRLPYFRAHMAIDRTDGGIRYRSERESPPAGFQGEYSPTGDVFHATPGSLEYFLAERYCLYTIDEQGNPLRAEIQHPPWPLQAAEATIASNTMTAPWGIQLPAEQPLLHFSRLQNVLIWPLRLAT